MSDYLPILPDELVAETILWRLPVKSIVQCRWVCKSWYFLITNRNFISKHLLHSKTQTPKNPQTFLGQCDMTDKIGRCLLHFDKQDYFRSQLLHLPNLTYDPCTQIVGVAKGLICFSIGYVNTSARVNWLIKFILFNPSIGHFQSISPPYMRDWTVRGFGFDESTQDYKILLIVPNLSYSIYSLNSHSWRRVVNPPNTPDSWSIRPFNSVVFVNGRFHWLASQSYLDTVFIRVFDVKTEAFGQISLPECFSRNAQFRLTEFGESSFAVIEQLSYTRTRERVNRVENHIWVMKEYGSVESWIKLATMGFRNCCELVLGFRNEDEVFIRLKSKSGCIVALQKINKDEQAKNLMHVDNITSLDFSVHTYVPSLVLLNNRNKVDPPAPPTHTIVDVSAPTPCRKRTRESVAHESPAAPIARRSQRIMHQVK